MIWRLSHDRSLDLSAPRVMAIINITPDSFADGGRTFDVPTALAAARKAVEAGAAILDLGAESTRPGAGRVPDDEQLRRLLPVVEAIRRGNDPFSTTPISIDTTRAAVAAAALDAGADAVNDVSGGSDDPAMMALAAGRGCGFIIMHRLALPAADTFSDRYANAPDYAGGVCGHVHAWLRVQRVAAIDAGVDPASIILDPGLGFGKSVAQNLDLIRCTGRLTDTAPVLSALSRKSFVGRVALGRDSTPDERRAGTLGLSIAHLHAGARLFRVHDVREHVEALAAAFAVDARESDL